MPDAVITSPKPAAPKSKKRFVRTEVSVGERISSWVIVALLGGIGLVIGIKGQFFDPAKFSLPEEALQSTIDDVEGKAATLRMGAAAEPAAMQVTGGETEDYENAAHGESDAVVSDGEALEVSVAGVTPMGATEFYSPDTLFEKINGRAPAYFEFNFTQLRCRSFSVGADGESFIDVFEYQMATPADAFGILSLERDSSAQPVEFIDDGYGGEMGYFFRQGTVYVQVIASDQEPATMELAVALARDRVATLPVDDTGLAARKSLPADNMVAGSVEFVRVNAQGQPFLKEVYQARYLADGNEVPFFLMVTTAAEAIAAWDAFREFSGKYGTVTESYEIGNARVFAAESFDAWRVVFQRGGQIGGVYDVGDEKSARKFVKHYLSGS